MESQEPTANSVALLVTHEDGMKAAIRTSGACVLTLTFLC